MLRLLSPLSLTLTVLALALPAAAQGPIASLEDAGPANAAAEVSEEQAEAYAEEYYEDDEYYEEEEFCGGGEETDFDLAWMAYDEEDYEGARETLAHALQRGGMGAEERAMYLVLLGEVQLRLNDVRHATVNYRRAIASVPEDADENGARLGLAVALLRNGRPLRALEEANTLVDGECTGDEGRSIACYVAEVVIAEATRDDAARDKARTSARQIRPFLRDYQIAAIGYYDELFDVTSWPAENTENTESDESSEDAESSASTESTENTESA